MSRKIFKIALATLTVMAFAYLSKPDRGGISRCASVFSLPEIHKLDLKHDPFMTWKPFEDPKFRFKISATDFQKLSFQLSNEGYSSWKSGGLQFGSVSVGDDPKEEMIYCRKDVPSYHFYWGYSPVEHVIHAITFRN